MKLKNHYFLLRHGKTIYQTKKKRIIYPFPEKRPVRLSKEGEMQIKEVAKILKDKKIDLIYSSDYFRTRQTAGIVAKELGLEVKLDKRLGDLKMGIFQGKTKEEYHRFFSSLEERFTKCPSGGESWQDLKKRILSFFRALEKKHKNKPRTFKRKVRGKTILIVSHGDPLWLMYGTLKGLSRKRLLKERFDYSDNGKRNYYPGPGQILEI